MINKTTVVISLSSINESLKAWFLTNKGELLGDCKFGSNIKSYLYELNTVKTTSNVKECICEEINSNFPIHVELKDIKIYYNDVNYKITIPYSVNSKTKSSVEIII